MTASPPFRSAGMEASVNGLRGTTLLLIVLTHYIPTAFFSGNIARPAAATMMVVTGYFFALVIERQSIETDIGLLSRLGRAAGQFVQRHLRIWPAVAGIVAVYVVLGFAAPDTATTQIHHTWPMYLLYMGNVVKMIYEANAFPAHFWLISAQEQFIALTLIAIALMGYRNIVPFLKVAIVVGVVARFIGAILWMPDHPALATETPLAVADALALGMLCRIMLANGLSRTRARRSATAAAIALTFLWAVLPNTYPSYFALVPLITALIGCVIIIIVTDECRGRRIEAAMLSWPALMLLGQMSLSLFLVHPLVNTLLRLSYAHFMRTEVPWWGLATVGPILSVIVAYGYFRAVEVPLRKLRRRRTAAPKLATAAS